MRKNNRIGAHGIVKPQGARVAPAASAALVILLGLVLLSGPFLPSATMYADAADSYTIDQVEAMIKELPFDPRDFSESDRERIEKIQSAYESLSADDQATLDKKETHPKAAQPLGRVLEVALWKVRSYGMDNSTSLPDGTYDATTTPSLASRYSKGKSTSGRDRPWSVRSVQVKDGKAFATITVESSSYPSITVGDAQYNQTNTSGNCVFEGVPIDLNGIFYFTGDSSSMPYPIAFTLTTTIDEPQCTVTFVDDDGTELSSASYDFGTKAGAIKKPATPSKADTDEFSYAFAGWAPALVDVKKNATYKATYTATKRQYNVSFVDEDGKTVLKAAAPYDYGTAANKIAKPATPTKASTAQYTYTFKGWDPALASVKADVTYKAVYDRSVNTYKVTFYDEDGKKVLKEATPYDYGTKADSIVKPGNPTKNPSVAYTYTFSGWTPALTDVTKDASYKATYTSAKRLYTVRFLDVDGNEISAQEVAYGEAATDPGLPEGSPGWDTSFNQIAGDTTVSARKPGSAWRVTFTDGQGGTLKEQDVEDGKDATPPANPERKGYDFDGWDTAYTEVHADTVVNATWKDTYYTVTFTDGQGKTIGTQQVKHGSAATAPDSPTREHYSFAGWSCAFNKIEGDLTVDATWEIDTYTITFTDGQGTVVSTQEVAYGSSAKEPAEPKREGYSFDGWDADFSKIEKTLTVNAVWKEKESPAPEKTAVEKVREQIAQLPADPTAAGGANKQVRTTTDAYLDLSAAEKAQLSTDERMLLVKHMILTLESDAYKVTGDPEGNIAAAQRAYDSLPETLRDELDDSEKKASLAKGNRSYGRYLENNVWALTSLDQVDNSTTLAAGTYSDVSSVTSTSNMGKSQSRRSYRFTLKKITVKDGKTYALLEHGSSTSDTLRIGGKEYANLTTDPSGNSTFEIPIDLNTTFYFSVKGKDATSETDAITYEMTTTVNESALKPDSPDSGKSEGKDNSDNKNKGGSSSSSSQGSGKSQGSQSSATSGGSGSRASGSGRASNAVALSPSASNSSSSSSSSSSKNSSSSSSKASSSSSSSSSKVPSSSSAAAGAKQKDNASKDSSKEDVTKGASTKNSELDSTTATVGAYPTEPALDIVPIIMGALLLIVSLGSLIFSVKFVQRENRIPSARKQHA